MLCPEASKRNPYDNDKGGPKGVVRQPPHDNAGQHDQNSYNEGGCQMKLSVHGLVEYGGKEEGGHQVKQWMRWLTSEVRVQPT